MTSELWELVLVWTVGGQDLQTTGQDQDGLSLLEDRWVYIWVESLRKWQSKSLEMVIVLTELLK